MQKKKVLFILAPKDFRDEEYFDTREVIEKKFVVHTSNISGKTSKSVFGKHVEVDFSMDKIDVNDYSALVFVGGQGCSVYFDEKKILDIAKASYLKGKFVCAICLAAGIISNAGIVSGKKITGSYGAKDIVEAGGGKFTGKDIEVSGRVITASGPEASKKFGEAISDALSKNNEE